MTDIVFVAGATRDLEAWWETNRPDAPGLVTAEVLRGAERLRLEAATLPVFRRVNGVVVRRLHLPRTHRHIDYQLNDENIVVLAVWGSTRGVLPRLRERLRGP